MLAVFGFLASHLAMVPCAHGGMSAAAQRERDPRPHFHWSGSHAGHEHQEGGHGHAHQDCGGAESSCVTACLACFDHDADAVYLTADWAVAVPRSHSKNDPSASWAQTAMAALPARLIDHLTRSAPRLGCHPASEYVDGSDLYLVLGQLRL